MSDNLEHLFKLPCLVSIFFPSCAAGHDVGREAMGASLVDKQRNEKNVITDPDQTKPTQSSFVRPPCRGTPALGLLAAFCA